MDFKIGIVKSISELQQLNDKFKKIDLVLECVENKYINTLPFEFTQNRVDLLNNIRVGERVKIKYNLKGREVTNKDGKKRLFVTLDCWDIESVNNEYPMTMDKTKNNQ